MDYRPRSIQVCAYIKKKYKEYTPQLTTIALLLLFVGVPYDKMSGGTHINSIDGQDELQTIDWLQTDVAAANETHTISATNATAKTD